MDRRQFLDEEFESVAMALREALRHDYGPERSKDFYDECKTRLDSIKHAMEQTPHIDNTDIADHLRSLASVGSRVALLERSHLGEFSWPFADAVRGIAERLFVDETVEGSTVPIVHVVAEGIGYQIFDDDLDRSFLKRIMIVAFPRQLKHHVLLHSIFGHELGHPAMKSDEQMPVIFDHVVPRLERGPLGTQDAMRAWLSREEVPADVVRQGRTTEFSDEKLQDWRFEILCDLFGLLLFGPAFAAAHRTILEPLCAPQEEYDLASLTHPPYPFRKRTIADAMRLLGWMEPTVQVEGVHREAEKAMLAYAGGDPPPRWTCLIEDNELLPLLTELAQVFTPHEGLSYERPDPEQIAALLDRLVSCRPPILQKLNEKDEPQNFPVPIQNCLYAGWTFWFGMDELRKPLLETRADLPKLTFLAVNRLCEQALLQQRAIDMIRQSVT